MKQGYGKISLGGSDSKYNAELQKISDKSLYTIEIAEYRAYLFGMLNSNGDKAEGYFSIGKYTSPKKKNFKEYDQEYIIRASNDINNYYKTYGIDGIKPLAFHTSWTQSKSVSFSIIANCTILPTLTNLTSVGNSDIEDIMVSWNSTNQDKYTITATVNDVVKYSSVGTTVTTHIISKNTFAVGDKVKILVKVEYTHNNTLSENAYASEEISINIIDIRPTLTEFTAINGLLSWKGTNLSGSSARVELYNIDLNNTKVADFEIPPEEFAKNKYFIPSTIALYNGNHLVRLIVSKNVQGVIYNTTTETTMAISNRPYVKINLLEPSGVLRNYEKDIQITWETINQQTYNLKVFQDNILKFEQNGTIEKSLILQKNTLTDGTATNCNKYSL